MIVVSLLRVTFSQPYLPNPYPHQRMLRLWGVSELLLYPWHFKYYSGPPGTSPLVIEWSPVLSRTICLTSRPYLCFSISSVHSDYDMLCSTLVLVPLCRSLHAVCTTLAFVPPVRSSSYCTFHSPSYSSALPLLLMLCFSIVYKLLDALLYSSLNIDLSNSSSFLLSSPRSSSTLFEIQNKNDSKGVNAEHWT